MPAAFGAFGKIPALGDFFRLNLPQGFVQAWDTWIQTALVEGRFQCGAAWTDRYMTAPIWRFALAPGYAGPEAVAGVMMPSVDRVGRQFPLTLAAVVPTDRPLRILALQAAALEALELVALDALDDAMTREALALRLAGIRLAPWADPSVVRASERGIVVSSSEPLALFTDLGLRSINCEAAFSTALEGHARLMATRGLPERREAAALFDLDAPIWSEGLT